MVYSPVSQMSRLPVDVEAVSMRWFWIRAVSYGLFVDLAHQACSVSCRYRSIGAQLFFARCIREDRYERIV